MSCEGCAHFSDCRVPCKYIEQLAGKTVPLREKLLDVDVDVILAGDYKAVLSEWKNGSDAAEVLRSIPDMRTRAVVAMLFAGLRENSIAAMLGVSTRSIYRLVSRIKEGGGKLVRSSPGRKGGQM